MNNSIVLANVKASLPSIMSNFTYDEFDKMFQTPKYQTSCAAYYQGARISDKIAVVFDLADGWAHRFVNSVRIYGSDGKGGTKMLREIRYPLYCGRKWSESCGKSIATSLIKGYVTDQCKVLGLPSPSDKQAEDVAAMFYEETMRVTDAIAKLQSNCSSQRKLK